MVFIGIHSSIFLKLFESAQIACFNSTERLAYEDSLKSYRDWKGITETAHEEGREQGREEGKQEVALLLISKGMAPEEASELTGINVEMLLRLSDAPIK